MSTTEAEDDLRTENAAVIPDHGKMIPDAVVIVHANVKPRLDEVTPAEETAPANEKVQDVAAIHVAELTPENAMIHVNETSPKQKHGPQNENPVDRRLDQDHAHQLTNPQLRLT